MGSSSCEKRCAGPYKPDIIIHGGAGAISRKNLPPSLYYQYHDSLMRYLKEAKALLDAGGSALDAACHAVCLLEDDPLFNCGRGSVFTRDGTNEMEASVMVVAADPHATGPAGSIKRGAAASLLRETRHPILLAKEVLLSPENEGGLGGTSTMHCHLSGADLERWGFEQRGLERKPPAWFWTERRWNEHRRELDKEKEDSILLEDVSALPSQGTVGAVCLDAAGNLAVATSTGGLTNKLAGRIGDTPTLGAGFWAEAWTDRSYGPGSSLAWTRGSTIPRTVPPQDILSRLATICVPVEVSNMYMKLFQSSARERPAQGRRAVAMSGTGNGDSFLRTNAVRTAAAICRLSGASLETALSDVAGPGGELEQSAGDRWGKTGEGEGGIIGIEVDGFAAKAVFEFNCGGLWRAWYLDGRPKVMAFRDEYEA
ncbi:hypothetical protein DV738_g5394, partial [Chaetothyriales sp. CBS 135597]